MKLIGKWIGAGATLLALGHVLPGFRVVDLNTALIVSALYGLLVMIVDALLIPFAYTIFIWVPRPLWNLACLLVVNVAVMFGLAHWVQGFAVKSLESAAIASVVLALVSALLGTILR